LFGLCGSRLPLGDTRAVLLFPSIRQNGVQWAIPSSPARPDYPMQHITLGVYLTESSPLWLLLQLEVLDVALDTISRRSYTRSSTRALASRITGFQELLSRADLLSLPSTRCWYFTWFYWVAPGKSRDSCLPSKRVENVNSQILGTQ
jgi:hypothetical protein